MLALYIICGIVAFIGLILLIPIRLRLSLIEDLNIYLYIGFLKINLTKDKPVSEQKEEKKPEKEKPTAETKDKSTDKKSGLLQKIKGDRNFAETFSYVKDVYIYPVLTELPKLASNIKIKPLYVNIVLGNVNKSADKLATEYGKLCALFYPMLAVISSVFDVRKQKTNLSVNYIAEENDIRFLLDFRTRVLHLSASGLRTILKIVSKLLKS